MPGPPTIFSFSNLTGVTVPGPPSISSFLAIFTFSSWGGGREPGPPLILIGSGIAIFSFSTGLGGRTLGPPTISGLAGAITGSTEGTGSDWAACATYAKISSVTS